MTQGRQMGPEKRTGERGKVKMERAMGGWELEREGEIQTMCRYVKPVSIPLTEIEKGRQKGEMGC